MIHKSYILEKNINSINENLFLFYGENLGLKNDLRNKIKNLNKKALIKNLDQEEILADENKFFSDLFNKSLFEETKIFFINHANDKILELIKEIEKKKLQQTFFYFHSYYKLFSKSEVILKNRIH